MWADRARSVRRGEPDANPLVGCVIIGNTGEIVGEGTYTRDGVVHAEAIALYESEGYARREDPAAIVTRPKICALGAIHALASSEM